MKTKTHPNYHDITVVMTDGTKFKTRSTWGKKGDELKLDVDKLTHPAWITGARKLVDTGGRVARFQKRFSSFGLKDGSTAAEPKQPPKPDAKGAKAVEASSPSKDSPASKES